MVIDVVFRRVSLVGYRGNILLDVYVRPTMPVTDYRTAATGIEAGHLNSGEQRSINHSFQPVDSTNSQSKLCI